MLVKKCPCCSSEFKTYPSHNTKHCSRKCRGVMTKRATYEKYKRVCGVCSLEFLPHRPTEGVMFCSYKCLGISNRSEVVDRGGYWYVCVPEHPRARASGHVALHTLLMEESLGRYLLPGEVVHHKDGMRKNNEMYNLQLMTEAEHKRHHIKLTMANGRINTPKQRAASSQRLRKSNPSKGIRNPAGQFTKSGNS